MNNDDEKSWVEQLLRERSLRQAAWRAFERSARESAWRLIRRSDRLDDQDGAR